MHDEEDLARMARSFDLSWPARQELAWLSLSIGASMEETLSEAFSELRSLYNVGCDDCPGCPGCAIEATNTAAMLIGPPADAPEAPPANLPA